MEDFGFLYRPERNDNRKKCCYVVTCRNKEYYDGKIVNFSASEIYPLGDVVGKIDVDNQIVYLAQVRD